MDTLHYLGLFTSFVLILYKVLYKNKVDHKNLPPSPPSLPIIGHFHLLKGKPIMQALLAISNHSGPISFLRLGSLKVLVVSSPSAVEECFTKNDIIFANRPHFSSRRKLEYNHTGLGSAPYGDRWRNLRRLTVIEIFSSARMQMTSGVRANEIRFLVKELSRLFPQKVDMSSFLYAVSFNTATRLLAGYRYFGKEILDLSEGRAKTQATKAVFYPEVGADLVDYFPILRLFPIRKKNVDDLLRKREDFIRGMIDANAKSDTSSSSPGARRTLISTLLSLQESEPECYTNELIYSLVVVLLVAGAHSSAMGTEQTISHLISHPEVFKKAREEIDANVPHDQLLDEAHLATLPYLDCIINESMRIGPVGSFIPLHESSEDCRVGGYDVPRGTMLFVNGHALHKDSKVWEDPNTFKPERFLGEVGEGLGVKFMPFGFGRRKCPGSSLALRSMALTLGTLIQCFEWEHCDGNVTPLTGPMEIIFRPRNEMVGALARL